MNMYEIFNLSICSLVLYYIIFSFVLIVCVCLCNLFKAWLSGREGHMALTPPGWIINK